MQLKIRGHGQLHAHFSNQPEGETVTTKRGWNIIWKFHLKQQNLEPDVV